jgi:acyl-CoA thioester hydrolase
MTHGEINQSRSQSPPQRSAFRAFYEVHSRWGDNDAYGHVNNVVYYEYFDTAVNRHLILQGVLDVEHSEVVGLVVETQCRYCSSVAFPDLLTVGLCVAHLGNSSVRYDIAIFRNNEQAASAFGYFVHVYVDRASNRPTSIPLNVRAVLAELVA